LAEGLAIWDAEAVTEVPETVVLSEWFQTLVAGILIESIIEVALLDVLVVFIQCVCGDIE
jgi:hypothetical protein